MEHQKELGSPLQDFNEEITKRWTETGLAKADVEEWLTAGLNIADYKFVDWLKHKKYLNSSEFSKLDDSEQEELRKECNNYSVRCDNCRSSGFLTQDSYFSSRKRNLDFCSQKCYKEWMNKCKWNSIHPDLTPQLQDEWREWEFTAQECQKWIEASLAPNQAQFAWWLENKGYVINEQERGQEWQIVFNRQQKKQLQTEYLAEWGDLHFDFTIKTSDSLGLKKTKIYQQLWQDQGFDKVQAQKYLKQGFAVADFMFLNWLRNDNKLIIEEINQEEIKSLRIKYNQRWTNLNTNFETYQQYWEETGISYDKAQLWINSGLKVNNFEVAGYLSDSINYTPHNWQNKSPAQHWLDWQYPSQETSIRKGEDWNFVGRTIIDNYGKKRNNITRLNIDQQNLTGSLDLSDFVNLERLSCQNNQLTSLIIPSPNQLELISTGYNFLTTFEFASLNPNTLTRLYIENNNLATTNLAALSPLVNLTILFIGNDNKARIDQGIINRWIGSLQSLQNCFELWELNIANTDINAGVEYLSENLQKFCCEKTKINEMLNAYQGHLDIDKVNSWKQTNSNLVKNAQMTTHLEKEYQTILNSLRKAFSLKENNFWWTRSQVTLNTLFNPNQAFYYWLSEKVRWIDKLRVENEIYYQSIETTSTN